MCQYQCSKCMLIGLRLYREYSMFYRDGDLLCLDCALETRELSEYNRPAWMVPAIPSPLPSEMWEIEPRFERYGAMTSVGFNWWKSLSIR